MAPAVARLVAMRRPLRRWTSLAAACVVVAIALVGHADDPPLVLHEYIPPDPKEDIELSATTPDGQLPAAMETRSGVVEAPDTSRMPTATEKAYGASAPRSVESKYNPDRDTRRPVVSRYDDPFSPATAPYKRLRAYDGVAADYTLTVMDSTLVPIARGGMVKAGEDAFFGDLTVDVVPGEPVRIPTVGPGARVVRSTTQPPMQLELVRDGAENWFVRGGVRARVRLVLQLAIAREAFGGRFPDSLLGSGRVRSAGVPPNVARSVSEVVRFLGLDNERSTRAIVTQMVTYFRGFEASEEAPGGRDNIYLDLALSRKGVCRHRAYAFVVTALGMGIPSRMVVNEAHAWVEVHDGTSWRRIDLGGASTQLDEDDPGPPRPAHQTPADPFPWPEGTDSGDSGAGMAERAREARGQVAPSGSADPSASPAPSRYSYQDPSLTGGDGSSSMVPATLTIATSDARVLRGSPMRVEGKVNTDLGPCAFVRVNVLLRDPRTSRRFEIGAVSTDEDGRFAGAVVVPLEMHVGDYDVVVATPGDARCGPGTSGP
jgi:transglutaminase-like putative cysteine protease